VFIDCEIHVQSNTPHLQQVYTGFRHLERAGRIGCRWNLTPNSEGPGHVEPHLQDAWSSRLRVVVNSEIRLVYDVHDSDHVDPHDLAWSDLYFKRSFSDQLAIDLQARHKLRPLGLNVAIYPEGADREGVRRSLRFNRGVERLRGVVAGLHLDRFVPRSIACFRRESDSFPAPEVDAEPRALFMTRTWDPDASRSPSVRDDLRQLNEFRAGCIRKLRSELGRDRFLGGFSHTSLAIERYPDCLLPHDSQASLGNYLRLLRDYPIGVTTKGLHRSLGWKLTEYVSQGKAIATESLDARPVGEFVEAENYLEFDTPDRCVEQVIRLVEDETLRRMMMRRNSSYASHYLVPQRMIRRTLEAAMPFAGTVEERKPGARSGRRHA